jgi:hypothetical protein
VVDKLADRSLPPKDEESHTEDLQNVVLALATSGDQVDRLTVLGIDGLSTADRAQQLSTLSTYSTDGTLLGTDGPLHLVVLQSTLKAGAGGTDLPAW